MLGSIEYLGMTDVPITQFSVSTLILFLGRQNWDVTLLCGRIISAETKGGISLPAFAGI